MADTEYLFIDGGCLRALLQRMSNDYFAGDKIDLRYERLSMYVLKTFYYDSLPHRKPNESEEDHETKQQVMLEFFNHLQSISGWHVYTGETRLRKKGKAIEQKKVDIMMAVDMLTHSFRRNMNRATLLTGDLDFKPLVDALVQGGMYVELWYPLEHTNPELIHAADSSRPLDIDRIYDWTTDAFKQTHGIPQVRTQVGLPSMSGYDSLATWKKRRGNDVTFYRGTGSYVVVTEEEHNPRHGLMITHSSLEPLKVYVAEKYPFIEWPSDLPLGLASRL